MVWGLGFHRTTPATTPCADTDGVGQACDWLELPLQLPVLKLIVLGGGGSE